MINAAGTPITGHLVAQLTPLLNRMAQRSVPAEQVEDLVQDTWLSALRSASGYEGRASIAAWLITILKRRIVDKYRSQRPGVELCEDSLAQKEPLAPERLQQAQLIRRVEGALSGLSELERAAVRLCDLEDCDRDAVAEELAISTSYLRVVLHRAHQKLASELRSTDRVLAPLAVPA